MADRVTPLLCDLCFFYCGWVQRGLRTNTLLLISSATLCSSPDTWWGGKTVGAFSSLHVNMLNASAAQALLFKKGLRSSAIRSSIFALHVFMPHKDQSIWSQSNFFLWKQERNYVFVSNFSDWIILLQALASLSASKANKLLILCFSSGYVHEQQL